MINSLTKIIGISVAAFIAVILIMLVLAKPILGQIDSLHNEEAVQKSQLDQLSAQLDAYNQAKTQLKQVNYTDIINNAIVKREDLAEAISEMEGFAAQTNVTETITNTDTQNGDTSPAAKPANIIPGEKNINEVPYDLHFSAKFADTLTFLQYMEHLPHYTEISQLSFSAQNAGASGNPNQPTAHTDYISGTISGVFFVKAK